MPIQALTGKDVIKLNNGAEDRIFTDLADMNCVQLEYPNALATVKTGKNGNSIFAWNSTGQNVKVTLRVIAASADDKWLNSALAKLNQDPPTFNLLTGQFIKKVGDGATNVSNVIYDLAGGIFTKVPAAMENVEGDVNQAVVIWEITFSNSPRSIA